MKEVWIYRMITVSYKNEAPIVHQEEEMDTFQGEWQNTAKDLKLRRNGEGKQ